MNLPPLTSRSRVMLFAPHPDDESLATGVFLQRAIAAVAGTARDARVVLRADGRATHQSVVTALDVLGRMGFAQLDVATIPPPAP